MMTFAGDIGSSKSEIKLFLVKPNLRFFKKSRRRNDPSQKGSNYFSNTFPIGALFVGSVLKG
jgi:hypothetical protein